MICNPKSLIQISFQPLRFLFCFKKIRLLLIEEAIAASTLCSYFATDTALNFSLKTIPPIPGGKNDTFHNLLYMFVTMTTPVYSLSNKICKGVKPSNVSHWRKPQPITRSVMIPVKDVRSPTLRNLMSGNHATWFHL